MSNHDGFAAVAQVRDTAINSALTIFHRSGFVSTSINNSSSFDNPFGSGSLQLDLDLFLDAPKLIFEESRGAILARFVLAGTVTLSGSGVPGSSRRVRMDADIVFAPSPVANADGVSIRLLAAGATLTSFSVKSVGGPVPKSVMDFLNSAPVRNQVASLVIAAAAAINSVSPPLLVPFIDRIGVGTLVNLAGVRAKVLDGALAVGLDLAPRDADFATNGNLGNVESFLSQSDIAVCGHPTLRKLMARVALPEVRAMAAEEDEEVHVDSLSIALADDHLKVTVHATRDIFGATITLRAKVLLGTPEQIEEYDDEYGGQYVVVTPGTDDIVVDIWDVQVDEELPWWVYLLAVTGTFILFPMAPVVIATIVSVVETIKANVANQIENAGSPTSTSRVQRITLPGTAEPFVDITVSQIKTSQGGFQTRAWFNPVAAQNAGKIVGPKTSTVEELADGDLTYTFTPDVMKWHPQNPLVDVRWQVRRTDNNQVIQSRRTPISEPGALSLSIDLGDPQNIGSPKYKVNCTILRNGSPDETLASDTLEVEIKDRLDRTHPFVQWDHTACVPRIERIKGILRQTGWDYVNRSSKIHKTKLPGRCRMAGQFSEQVWPIQMHYADALPFDSQMLKENRDRLCDYCFFGGPDKAEPLPL